MRFLINTANWETNKLNAQEALKDEEITTSINAFVNENKHPDSTGVDAKEPVTKESPNPNTETDIDTEISASIAAFVASSEYRDNEIDITNKSQGIEPEV